MSRKDDNLTAIYEPTVYKMWEPRRLTTPWAYTACCRDIFIFFRDYFLKAYKSIVIFDRFTEDFLLSRN
jgi:hypothetical protein